MSQSIFSWIDIVDLRNVCACRKIPKSSLESMEICQVSSDKRIGNSIDERAFSGFFSFSLEDCHQWHVLSTKNGRYTMKNHENDKGNKNPYFTIIDFHLTETTSYLTRFVRLVRCGVGRRNRLIRWWIIRYTSHIRRILCCP